MRVLDRGYEKIMDILPRTPQIFTEFSECTNSDLYYTLGPQNFPCINSVILRVGYFRMTTSLNPEITWKRMKEIKNAMKMHKLFFVVPHTKYKGFKKQKFARDMKNKEEISVSSLEDPISKMEISKEVDEMNKENEAQLMNINNEGNSEEDLVQQLVISIPIDADMVEWLDKIEQTMSVV